MVPNRQLLQPTSEAGTLSTLTLAGVGPAKHLQLAFAPRLNLLTGDNGLGKSFILESVWWALSGYWVNFPAFPREDANHRDPQITFQIRSVTDEPVRYNATYDWERQAWSLPDDRWAHADQGAATSGLLLYARVDGAFAVWDPVRDQWGPGHRPDGLTGEPILLEHEQIWNGLELTTGGKTTYVSNGLIVDWINWQNSPDAEPFDTLKKVLRRLSPPSLELGDLGILEPGKPRRIPGDSRLIPTIKHSYGEVPLVYASAGVRRVVALAYLIVWAWEEHKTQAKLQRKDPQRRMVILIDEIEAHLHPQWQRKILPALLSVWQDLQMDVQMQLLIATHSPLVMASVEPLFDPNQDRIFHIDLIRNGATEAEVTVESPEFVVYGTVDSWLRSDIFELGQARSLEAEQALTDAKQLQVQGAAQPSDVIEVHQRLVRYLSAHDEFWPRWTYFATRHGVEL